MLSTAEAREHAAGHDGDDRELTWLASGEEFEDDKREGDNQWRVLEDQEPI